MPRGWSYIGQQGMRLKQFVGRDKMNLELIYEGPFNGKRMRMELIELVIICSNSSIC